mgnify:CR=1 FL=1
MNYRLSIEPDALPQDLQLIRDSINEFNMTVTGDRNYSPLVIFLRDESDIIVGGILGDVWGGWLHITYLWVSEVLRQHGYGRQLVEAAETQARTKGCRGVFLETFSFQARPFYEKLGYKVCGEVPDYPQGHTYYFLKKWL